MKEKANLATTNKEAAEEPTDLHMDATNSSIRCQGALKYKLGSWLKGLMSLQWRYWHWGPTAVGLREQIKWKIFLVLGK